MKHTLLTTIFALFLLPLGAQNLKIDDINIRDPFILVKNGTYYMYASSTVDKKGGVGVYTSKNLQDWTPRKQVMVLPDDNWSTGRIWAPEVHEYQGKYYLFATVNCHIEWKMAKEGWAPYYYRGTQVFKADSPEGPFEAISQYPQTPMDFMALDGTLYVENGTPYMVFCHEWVQLEDGTIEYVKLSDDLSEAVGAPVRLFNGSSSCISQPDRVQYVTDGCFMYRTKTGKLLMIWSTFGPGDYGVCIAESVTGSIRGPWRQQKTPLFQENGGHGMVFTDLDGKLRFVLHAPNSPGGAERARIFTLEDTGDSLRIVE